MNFEMTHDEETKTTKAAVKNMVCTKKTECTKCLTQEMDIICCKSNGYNPLSSRLFSVGFERYERKKDRTIIYCQTIKQCANLYSLFLKELDFNKENHEGRKVEMLHALSPKSVKENILKA